MRKRFNLVRKYYVFADILCRRSRALSLQESLQQRIDNIFCESSCCLIPPTLNICSAAPKKPFLKPPPTIDFCFNSKKVYFSVEDFHSDLSIDDRSTLDPTYTSESSVTSSTMSDEMAGPIFDDDWNVSDVELESEDVRSEEVEVAIGDH